jgi:hypothetical protein
VFKIIISIFSETGIAGCGYGLALSRLGQRTDSAESTESTEKAEKADRINNKKIP